MSEQLNMLRAKHERIYETHREMMCHFHICANILGIRFQRVDHKVWASYLFRNLNESLRSIASHKFASQEEIEKRIVQREMYLIQPNR